MSMQFAMLWPAWLVVAITALLAGSLLYGTIVLARKHVAGRLIALLTLLRLAIMAVFLLILLQPVLSFTRVEEQKPEMIVLVDTSASMKQPAANGGGNRLQEVVGHLRDGDFAKRLRARHGLSWFSFDATASPIDEARLAQLQPNGATTQFAESLSSVRDYCHAIGKKPQRVLLVTDGNDLGAADPAEIARQAGWIVDVLPPAAVPMEAPPRFEIADVQSARRVLLGSETQFRLTLRGNRPPANDIAFDLLVTEDGAKVIRQKLILKAGQAEQIYALEHRPATIGLKHYDFRLEQPGTKPGDYRLAVQVVDSKYEVLILEDTWRWEYKFLHRLFEDDPSFRFSALLSRGKGTYVQFGSPDRRVNLIGFPQNRAELEGFDTFVVGDVNPVRWPSGLAAALAQQITEEGKTLVVIAGPNLANFLDVPELNALLPVELTRESGTPVEGPITVRFRPDASASPFFFQLPTDDADRLPPFDQVYAVLRKRAGATVLLEAVKQRNAFGNLIVLAEHTVDRGRVLFVGTDTLWKWHTLTPATKGPSPYNIFWQQAFRALAPARSNVGQVNLWLTPERTRSQVDRPITVHAEVQSARPLPSLQVQGLVMLPDGKRIPLAFRPDAGRPQVFHTDFAPPAAGAYKITATATSEQKQAGETMTAIQVDEPRRETDDAGVDLANLARIAATTGGKLVDAARPETWPSDDGVSLPAISQLKTVDLWNNFTLLLLLCGLLGIDWFVRLFKGLV